MLLVLLISTGKGDETARDGWLDSRAIRSRNPTDAMAKGSTWLTEDADQLIDLNEIDVVVEATGIPTAGIHHCRRAIAAGHHIIMVNVEADVVAGPLLAREAQAAGVVYSLAWGDQPALICEHVDWARTCGFEVVCAGKGTRYHPSYHELTPDSVWEVLQQYLEIDDPTSINMKMFNSFLDGSKSGIEMSAVCNTTGLTPQDNGLGFPPSSRFDLATSASLQKMAAYSVGAAPPRWCHPSHAVVNRYHIIWPWAPTWWSKVLETMRSSVFVNTTCYRTRLDATPPCIDPPT